jgi:hypothetical protein
MCGDKICDSDDDKLPVAPTRNSVPAYHAEDKLQKKAEKRKEGISHDISFFYIFTQMP